VRGANQRAESCNRGIARIDGESLAGTAHGGVQVADGDSGLRDNCHVVRLVRDDSRQARHRDTERDRRTPDSSERASRPDGSQRDTIRFAHPYDLANLLDRRRLDDQISGARFSIGRCAKATGTDYRLETVRELCR
jgi:hypothetical protein